MPPAGKIGQRPVRTRNREQTVTAILDSAESLLDRKGPDGFGLAELGREAGVSFGLIHHYFGGKEGLLRAVLQRTLRNLGREIRGLQSDGTFWRRDSPAVGLIFDTFSRHPGIPRLLAWGLLTGLILPSKDGGEVADNLEEDRAAIERMLVRFTEDTPGTSRDDAAAMAALLISAVLGFNLLRPMLVEGFGWDEDGDKALREQLVRAMAGLASAGRA